MAQMASRDGHVEVGGVRIRYMESGQGAPLVHVHPASELRLTPAHDLLCRRFRVVAFEMPEPSPSLASTMAQAIRSLGLDTFNLMSASSASSTALRLALQAPERVLALVLATPGVSGPDRDADLESRLPGLATPTLVLCGTRDRGVAPALGRVYKELLPNGHLVFVYDAAQAIGTDRPEAFAEVVADFLERREAFVISRAATVIHLYTR